MFPRVSHSILAHPLDSIAWPSTFAPWRIGTVSTRVTLDERSALWPA